MKLTEEKIKQLIVQEMKNYVQVAGERGMRTDPEFHDKLLNIYKSDPEQAKSLADALDQPIYAPIDDKEEFEEFLPFGIRQFEQGSFVTVASMFLGYIEIFYDTGEDVWAVAFYRGTSPNGALSYDGSKSKEYSNAEEAINHYNAFADNKFVRSKPLRKNTDYTPHPDNPYTKK